MILEQREKKRKEKKRERLPAKTKPQTVQ